MALGEVPAPSARSEARQVAHICLLLGKCGGEEVAALATTPRARTVECRLNRRCCI